MANAGHSVTLVTKRCRSREEPGVRDDFAFYGVEPGFSIVKLPRPGLRGGGALYAAFVFARLLASRDTLVYTRDPITAWLASRLKRTLIFEQHGVLTSRRVNRLIDAALRSPCLRRLVLVSGALQASYLAAGRHPRHGDIVVAHDGADAPSAPQKPPAMGSRPRIGYVGSFYPGKGVDMVIELARRIPEAKFEILGGDRPRLARLAAAGLPPNLELVGFVGHGELKRRYPTFDVLLMPYGRRVMPAGGDLDISRFMSPLKMFEYMASGVAILSSDMPVLREVLEHERNAILVPPEEPESWERALRWLIGDPQLRRRLGESARKDLVDHFTWAARAQQVLEGV
ncbi:MAG: glycosyltransferase family 4 protein [Acidobacteriota bacterium]|nr:glycosyltransferase family 4 protein [Acidobacteriota bacterium]